MIQRRRQASPNRSHLFPRQTNMFGLNRPKGSGRIAFTRAGPGLHYPIFFAHFLAQDSANCARMMPFAASVSPIKR
jgi:hypothetical protein